MQPHEEFLGSKRMPNRSVFDTVKALFQGQYQDCFSAVLGIVTGLLFLPIDAAF